MIIDQERPDDYAAAIENNRAAAVTWLNTALKQMSHEVAVNGGDAAKIEQYTMRNGSKLIVLVTFSPPKETT